MDIEKQNNKTILTFPTPEEALGLRFALQPHLGRIAGYIFKHRARGAVSEHIDSHGENVPIVTVAVKTKKLPDLLNTIETRIDELGPITDRDQGLQDGPYGISRKHSLREARDKIEPVVNQ